MQAAPKPKKRLRPRRRFFIWFLPLLWTATVLPATKYSGDEYGMLFVGAMAGTWYLMVFGDSGDFWTTIAKVIVVGVVVLALFGWLMDAVRVPRRAWWLPWPLLAVIICIATIRSYPSYERAIAKNGSLQTYVLFSMNYSLYLTVLGLLVITPLAGWNRYRPPAGTCPRCRYDLTGNESGVCPECGEDVRDLIGLDRRGTETQRTR